MAFVVIARFHIKNGFADAALCRTPNLQTVNEYYTRFEGQAKVPDGLDVVEEL